ncbi:MAG TPA: LamG-like jellyroll fold domain-containing protein [Verrucomicrobiae bacterium]|nr:LamG-like jellyroll fold domain-containing protein [Verrucomicrobiae bacterium]
MKLAFFLRTVAVVLCFLAASSGSAQSGGPGQALNFDGSSQYVSVANPPTLGTNFTIEAWILPQPVDDLYHGILGFQPGDSAQRAPSLWIHGQSGLHAGFGDGTNWISATTPAGLLRTNDWNHVAASYDGATYRLLLNGAVVFSTNVVAVPYATPLGNIGRVDNYFPGSIDEVRVWNTPRSTEHIQLLMHHRVNGSEPGLVVYYHFDEGSGASTADAAAAAGASTGTLVGNPNWISSSAPIGLSAVMRDELVLDADNDGKISPGDRIRYTVVLTNSSGTDLQGLQFGSDLGTNVSVVSVNTSPVARPDSYNAIGNTLLTVNAAAGVLANDSDADGNAVMVDLFDTTTANGGTVVVNNADGSFTYLPAAGFTGTDTFSYRITDSGGAKSAGLVTVTVAEMVWYVDANAAPGGDGRSTQPFQNFTSLNGNGGAGDVDGTGHYIYVRTGTYDSSLRLEAEQKLTGQGVDLVVAGQTLETAVARPKISPASGTAIVLSTNNVVRGLDVNPLNGKGIAGTNFASVQLSTVSVTANGGAALDLSSGSVSATISILGSTNSPGEGMRLVNLSGTLTVTNGLIRGASGTDIHVDQGAPTITYAGSITNTGGRSIVVQNLSGGSVSLPGVIVDSGTGILLQNNVSGSSTITFAGTLKQLNTGSNTAMTIANNAGATIQFLNGGLDIDTTTGIAASLSGDGAVTISGGNNSINSTSGTAFAVSGGNGTIACDANITNTTGRVVEIQNRTGGTITLSGTLHNSGTGILVQNNNTGSTKTIQFTGSAVNLNTGANAAATLANNSGTTIDFTGGALNIDATSGAGFSVTGGAAAINVTGSANTIDVTTGTALNVANSTIGSSGLTFRRITSNGGSNTGIILDNTGSSGGLTVTGTGSAGSGGTIANKSGSDGSTGQGTGVYLNNCVGVSLSHLQMNDFQNRAIYGSSVSGFTLANSIINGVNGNSAADALGDGDAANDDACVSFRNLTGTATILNCTISGGFEDNVRVINSTGTLNRLNVANVTFGLNGTASGDNSLLIQAQNFAVLNASIVNSTFNGARGDVFQFDLGNSSTGDLVFSNNLCINTHSAIAVGGGGITVSGGGVVGANPQLTYDINANTFRGARGDAILVALQTGSGTFTGRIRNNTIGLAATDSSGSREASGIEVRVVNGTGTQNVTIDNNQIRQYSNFGIYLATAQGSFNGTINASVINNTVANPSTFDVLGFKRGIYLEMGASTGDAYSACVDIRNNTTAGSGDGGPGGPDIRLRRVVSTCTIRLPGYGGGDVDTTAVANFIAAQNIGAETVTASGSFLGGVACPTP